MAAQVLVHLTSAVGLAGGLEQTYREQFVEYDPDDMALLVPTNAAAAIVRRQVLCGEANIGALVDPRIMTFAELAESVLVANHSHYRRISPLQQRMLVAELLALLHHSQGLAHLSETYAMPGTANSMCALLEELKHAGISSADFETIVQNCCPGNQANADVAAVFFAYQERLQELELYDVPGLLGHAVELLHAENRQPLQDLKVLLLDGFRSFTAVQMEMIAKLATFVERVEIRLWRDENRPEMTPLFEATIAQLQNILSSLEVQEDDSSSEADESNLSHLRQHMFASQAPPAGEVDASVQVLEAAGGVVGECREVARRIKLLLTGAQEAGTDRPRANQVVVMLRSWDSGHADALRQVLTWYGIPAEFSRGPALASVPAVQAALDVLDVVSSRWRRQDVLKLLGSNYVQCLPGDGVQIKSRQFEKLTLEAGIIGGSDAPEPWEDWAAGFARLGTRLQSERTQRQQLDSDFNISSNPEWSEQTQEDDDGNRLRPLTTIDALIGYVEQCSTVVGGLRELLQPLSDAESMADAAKKFSDILKNLDIVGAVDSADVRQAAKDQQGLTQLSELLAEIAEAPVDPPESSDAPAEAEATAATMLPTEFASLVRRACSEMRLQIAGRRGVGVQVLDMTEAGFEQFEVLFICGMRDGLLPRRGPADVFYPDADRASLQEENPGLRPRSGQIHDDKQLLHAALSAARKQVWLTYPLTEADGSPVLRSPYVDEVLRHWEESDESPSELVHTRRQSQVIEQLKGACHYLEVLEAVQAMQAHPPQLQDTQIQEVLNELASGSDSGGLPEPAQICELSQIGWQRADASENSAFAGIISNAAITADLATSYGQDYIFSASSLNSYAACPMQFYFRYVLGLEGLEEPTDDTDIRDLGLLAHRILSAFYGQRTIGTDNDAPLTNEDLPAAYEQLEQVINGIADSWAQTVFGARGVWEMAIERMRQDLRAVLKCDAEKNSATGGTGAQLPPRRVRAVEVRYGQSGGLPICTDATIGPIRVQGSIDRIDLAEADGNSKRWVLWDYKSSDGPTKKLVTSGIDVQLPLYAMAVEQMYPGEAAGFLLWGYWQVRRPVGWRTRLLASSTAGDGTPLLDATIAQARQMIGQHVSGIRSGKFPPEPHDGVKPCRYCDFGDICGNRKSRK